MVNILLQEYSFQENNQVLQDAFLGYKSNYGTLQPQKECHIKIHILCNLKCSYHYRNTQMCGKFVITNN